MAQPKITFKGLKDLSASKRMEAARQEGAASLLDRLTPTEFAQLFPDYFKRGTPDVSGFRLAVSRKSQDQQQTLTDEIKSMAENARKKADSAYEYVKKKLTGGGKPIASLTPEQDEAFKAIQKGAIPASGSQGAIFSRLSKTQLASIGVELTTDDKGNKVYKYSEPTVTREEAISRARSGGNMTGRERAVVDMIAKREGAKDPNTIFGGNTYKAAVGYNKPLTEMTISEVIEMQKKMTQVTAAAGVAGGRGTSAVGKGQFVRGTLISNLKAMGINEDQWDKVKFTEDLQDKLTIQNFRTTVGDPNEPRTWNQAKLGQQWESFDTSKGKAPLGSTEVSAVYTAGTDRPSPDGKLSEEQITKIEEQLKTEKNAARRQQLANLLQDATGSDQPTATVNTAGTDKWDSVAPRGSTHWCARGVVHLSKQIFKGNPYFDGASVEGHGNAADYTKGSNFFTNSGMYQRGERISKDMLTPEFLASLPPGTIVAQGGADYASRFGHIQMKVGNKWVSDHTQNKGFYKDNVSGRNYTDFTIMRLTPQGEKSLADSGYLNLSDKDKAKVASVETAPAPPPPQPTMEDIKREVPVNNAPEGEDKPDAEAKKQEQPKQEAPKPTAKVEPQTATVTKPEPPKPMSQRFKLNEQALIAEIKKVDSRASMPFVSDDMIMNGFKEEVAKYGMTVDKGVVTVKDMNHPEIKKIQETMDIKKFATPIEEKKPEPPKPVPEKKAEAPKEPPKMDVAKAPEPPKPEQKPVDTSAKQAAPEPPKEQPKVEPKKTSEVEAPKVKTAASGGSFNVGDQGIEAYPISGIKNDNTVVVNKQQQPLFTMNSKETATFDPSKGKVDVIPKSANVSPAPDRMEQHVSQLRNEMNSVFSSLDEKLAQPMVSKTPERDDNPNMLLDLMNMTKTPYQNPTFQRAMSRTRMHETGDATNDFHYSAGNKNQA